MARRPVGRLGEETLRKLVSEADAVVTRTAEDRWGWDYMLEYPLPRRAQGAEADREEEVCRCLIQVKSTDSTEQTCAIKVSNWRRLIEASCPAFIVALHFGGGRDCHAVYVLHIWEREMTAALRRIRELSVAGEGDRLHKHTLAARWSEENKLLDVSGEALLARITECVGPSPIAYSERKVKLWKGAGYDTGNAVVTVRFNVPPSYRNRHPDDLLVDSLLGLAPDLQIAGGEVRDLRFGIPSKHPKAISAGSRLRMGPPKPVATGNFRLRTADKSREEGFPAQVLVPSGVRYDLARTAQKVVFRLPYADFVVPLYGTAVDVHYNLPAGNELVALSEAACVARLLGFIRDASADSVGRVELWLDDNKVGVISGRGLSIPAEHLDWSAVVLMATRVAGGLGFPEGLRVTVDSLLAQRNALTMVDAALGDPALHNLTFTFVLHRGSAPAPGEQMGLPIHLELNLGGKRAVVFATPSGIPEGGRAATGEYRVPVTRASIDKVVWLNPGEALPKNREDYLDEVASRHTREGGILCWWKEDLEYLS